MKRIFKLSLILMLAGSLLLAGCTKKTVPGSRVEQGEIIDENDVKEIDVNTDVHNFVFVSQNGNSYSYRCIDDNQVAVVKVEYLSGTAGSYSVSGNTITFKNITADSVYAISGDFYGNIVIDVTDNYQFELELRGLNLYSYYKIPITILSGDKVTISAKKLTQNYLYDLRDEGSASGSIYSECDLDIQGKGNLYIKSVHNDGIYTKDDLNVKNLRLQIECMDNALKGNDSVSIESGDIILIASKGDGIKTKNTNISSKGNQRGTIAITGGEVLIYAASDGIDASFDVIINENSGSVSLQIFTAQYSKYSETVSQTDDDNTDTSDYSSRGIKADNKILISAGEVTICSYDDSICANNDAILENGATALGNVTITGGDITLYSKNDGIKADNKAMISGGVLSVIHSYEGIQGKVAEIAGGNVSIIAQDDGINGTGTSGESIIISGGYLYVYTENGDGIDSNSTSSYDGILFSGGHSVIISLAQSHGSLDSTKGYKYTGGHVVAIGRSGDISNESAQSSPSISSIGTTATLNLQSGNYLVVSNIVTVAIPASIDAFVILLGDTNVPISSCSSISNSLDVNGVYWK